MAITLPDNLREALAQAGDEIVVMQDPATHRNYVLLPQKEYDRIRHLLGRNEAPIAETYPAQDAVARAQGWDEPVMDEYNHYDLHKKSA